MNDGFTDLQAQVGSIEGRLSGIDAQLVAANMHILGVQDRLNSQDTQIGRILSALGGVDRKLDESMLLDQLGEPNTQIVPAFVLRDPSQPNDYWVSSLEDGVRVLVPPQRPTGTPIPTSPMRPIPVSSWVDWNSLDAGETVDIFEQYGARMPSAEIADWLGYGSPAFSEMFPSVQ